MEGPANDAHLIQLVKTRLGRRRSDGSQVNVSSCKFVITLHGNVSDDESAGRVLEIVRGVAGVEGVEDRMTRNDFTSGA